MKHYLETGLGRWVAFCEFHPRAVFVGVALVTALIGLQVWQNFAINSDLSKLIRPSDDLEWYRTDQTFKATFPELQQTSIVVVSGADLDRVDASARRLRDAFAATGRFEFVFAPALDEFFRVHRAYFLEPGDLESWVTGVQYDYGAVLRLADGADLANAAFTLADQVTATDGLRLPTVLASLADDFIDGVPDRLTVAAYPHLEPDADVHYVTLMLKGELALDERLPAAAQVALIRETVALTPPDPDVRVRLTGEIPLSNEEISQALDGIGIAGLVSLVLLALILHFGVRSWRVAGATFCLLGVGVVWTLGFATAAVGSFNTLALIFVVMFFGLGVDFAIHFSLRLWESLAPGSDEDPEVHVVHEIGPALLLCMLTSAIAFLSFVPTDYRGLGELGVISAGGMAIAFVLTLTLLPAFYALFGLPERRSDWSVPGIPAGGRWTVVIAGVVFLGALWFARDLSFDYSVLALRDETTEAMSTLLELQENGITTDYSINLLAADADEAARLKDALGGRDAVGDVLVPADLVPEGQDGKRQTLADLGDLLANVGPVTAADWEDGGGEEEALQVAIEVLGEAVESAGSADRERVGAFLAGLQALSADAEARAALNRQFHDALEQEIADLRTLVAAEPFGFEDLPADLQRRLVSEEGVQLVTVQPARAIGSRADTEAFIDAVSSVTPALAGRAVVEWGVGDVAVRSFLQATALAVVLITVLLMVHFRGVVLPLAVLVPLTFTTAVTFAVINLTPLTLNMANILVIPLIFGLGVDTGIHVVHRFRSAADVSSMLSSSTSRAVVISALTTIGTFFSLSFSPHKGAASVGELLSISIAVMLIATFALIPPLVRRSKSSADAA